MRIKTLFLSIFLCGVAVTVHAQSLPQGSLSSLISAYESYKSIESVPISVPTVIEIPFADEFIERFDFAVVDTTTNLFEPHYFKQEVLINEIPVSVRTNSSTRNANWMHDGTVRTYSDFSLPNDAKGRVEIILSSTSPITSSALTTLLDTNVALPNEIEIRAFVDGENKIVVANRRMDQQTIRYPQTTSNTWIVAFTFGQPLRISELQLQQDNATKSSTRAIRFLAQPSHSYRIYFNPDRSAPAPVGESGNVASAKDVLVMSPIPSRANPNYSIADVDSDGTPDIRDNCISVTNADQQDVNNNGRGDACDDFDQDGLINAKDNCRDNPNRDQRDTDSDGKGDVCDKEESRITERFSWIPWVGIGFAALVLITLFAVTATSTRISKKDDRT